MTYIFGRLKNLVYLAVFLNGTITSTSYSVCLNGQPEGILQCMSNAYSERDYESYRALLADDFVYFSGRDSTSWGLKEELAATKSVFSSATKINLQFPGDFKVAPGDTTDTWVLTGVTRNLKIEMMDDGKPKQFTVNNKGQVVGVRKVAGPQPHFVIYGWWDSAK